MSIKKESSSPTVLLSQINSDYLSCQICMDTYRQPKVLKCQHTFCRSCLESCSTTDSGSYMSCPVCREKTLLGMKGVAGLKDNFAFSSMIEMLERWNESKCIKNKSMESLDGSNIQCSTCPTETEATHQCLDCLEKFCVKCAAFHQRTKLTKDHEILLIKDIQSGLHNDKIRLREQSRCKEHEAMMLHYCSTCEKPACKDCVIEKHQSHNLKTIEEAGEARKEIVLQLKTGLEEGVDHLKSQLRQAKSQKLEESTKLKDYRDEIIERAQKIKKLVKKRQKELLEELDKVETKNSNKLDGCIDRLSTHKQCIENCIQLSTHILEADTSYEILAMHAQIQDTVEHLTAKTSEVTKRNQDETDKLISIKFELPDFKQMEIPLGDIIQEMEKEKITSERVVPNSEISPAAIQPKVAPRRNITATSDRKPKPAMRSTQLITAKELATLNEALSNSTPPPSGQLQRLSLQKDELIRSQSTTDLPKLTSNETEETRQKAHDTGTVPSRKPRAPRPPIPHPGSPPIPPPQTKKPSTQKSFPLPLRGILYTKFGKKGKTLTNGEFMGMKQHVIFSRMKFRILALDPDSKHILIFSGDGVFKKSFKVVLPDQTLKAVAIAELGKTHVLVLFKKFITEWAWDGRLVCKWGENDLVDGHCITTDTQDRILVSDQERHAVFIYDSPTKSKVMQIGGYGDGEYLFKSPRYICTSKSDNIIVSDHHNHCVKVFKKNGSFIFKCGAKGTFDGDLKYPEGIDTVTLSDGSEGIIVADEGNCRVSLFTSDGRFLGHVLTKADDKNLRSPQILSISHTGQELVLKQANQIGIRVYKLSTVGCY